MPFSLLTLPDVEPTSPKGIAHLIIVGLLIGVSLIGIIIITIAGQQPPDILTFLVTAGVAYLFGANAASKPRKE